MSSDGQVVLVSRKSESREESKSEMQSQLHDIKVTNNLINEINFNSTVNRFEYLEELLSKEHALFITKMTTIVNQQKDLIKHMKNLQKHVREIKQPNINYNRVISQSQELIRVKKQSDKNIKLSLGMINALAKMEKEIDALGKKGQESDEPTEQIL